MLPKISIITPCLNKEMFFEEAILNLLRKDYPNLEHILKKTFINDGWRNWNRY